MLPGLRCRASEQHRAHCKGARPCQRRNKNPKSFCQKLHSAHAEKKHGRNTAHQEQGFPTRSSGLPELADMRDWTAAAAHKQHLLARVGTEVVELFLEILTLQGPSVVKDIPGALQVAIHPK